MSLFRKIEKSLDHRLRSIFSDKRSEEPEAREAIELYRDAMDQVSARAQLGRRGERVFPFNVVTVELHAATAERKAMLEALFDAAHLSDDIRATLHEERVEAPADLAVHIHYNPEAVVEMRVLCEKVAAISEPVGPAAPVPVRAATLVTVSGSASQFEFVLDKPRVNIGRDPEVMDNLGRLIRRNELNFPEEVHSANASVSRAHAHLSFDSHLGEWRIFDDGSSLGTSLFRDGHRIEVPAHGSRGVVLMSSDEIYLGQVQVRFVLDHAEAIESS